MCVRKRVKERERVCVREREKERAGGSKRAIAEVREKLTFI